jgi:VWFA-related protein
MTTTIHGSGRRARFLSLLALVLACPAAISAAGQRFRSDADLVRIEVVARDSAGHPVLGLTRQQFTVLEDGRRQEISAFVEVSAAATDPAGLQGPGHASTAVPTGETRRQPREGPSLIALVVDRVTPEARAFLAKALTQFVETSDVADYIGVFSSESGLRTLHTFTKDRLALLEAIQTLAATPSAQFGREHERNKASGPDAHPSVPVVASAESAGRPITPPGKSEDEAALDALGASNSWEILARDQQGYATTNALRVLAATLGRVEGRKSVVFFADHLAIPDAVLPHFNNVVATAGRAQVSIYTVDVAGLRVHSTDAEIGREVRAIGAAGLKTNDDGSSNSNLTFMERNEDVLRKDPRTSLTLLADRTGGAFTGTTNDLARGLRMVIDDHAFYYVLGYAPKDSPSKEQWRKIQVKVDGRRVILRHRQGYVSGGAPSKRP